MKTTNQHWLRHWSNRSLLLVSLLVILLATSRFHIADIWYDQSHQLSRYHPRDISKVDLNFTVSGGLQVRQSYPDNADPNWAPAALKRCLGKSDEEVDADTSLSAEDKKKIKAVNKGFQLRCIMMADTEVFPSAFVPPANNPSQDILKEYGWTWGGPQGTFFQPYFDNELAPALDGIGVSREKNDWYALEAYNNDAVKDLVDSEGVVRKVRTMFENPANLKDGMFICMFLFGVADQLKTTQALYGIHGDVSDDRIVKLRRWSDVTWLAREKLIAARKARQKNLIVKELEHVLHYKVTNIATRNLVLMVTGKSSVAELGQWPGMIYSSGGDSPWQMLALLGAPNALGTAWLLAQHKASMGVRTVDRILVFNCPQDQSSDPVKAQLCLYLHVEAVSGIDT